MTQQTTIQKLLQAQRDLDTANMANAPGRAKVFAQQSVAVIKELISDLDEALQAVREHKECIILLQQQLATIQQQAKGREHG